MDDDPQDEFETSQTSVRLGRQVRAELAALHRLGGNEIDRLLDIFVATSLATGQAYFDSLTTELAEAFAADYVLIGSTALPEPDRITTLSLWADGEIVPGVEYDLAGSPCAEVLDSGICVVADAARRRYPEDHLLVEMEVESYAGTALALEHGGSRGLLSLLFRRALNHAECESLGHALRVLAGRASVEIDRQRLHQERVRSEQRYRMLFEHSSAALVVYDYDRHRIVDANGAAEELFDLPLSRLIEMDIVDVSPLFQENGRASADEALRHLGKALEEGSDCFEWLHRRTDGRLIPCEIRLQRLPSRDARLIRGSILDITERRRALEELASSERHLRGTLDSLSEGVITLDEFDRIRRMNPAAERLCRWTRAEARGLPIGTVFKLLVAGDPAPVENPVAVLERPAAGRDLRSLMLITRDGEKRFIAGTATPMRDDRSQNQGTVMVFRDITEELQKEEQLRQAHKMDTVGQLAGGIAHDFNNMLAGILGTADLLVDDLPEAARERRHLETIIKSAERAADLTQKLLAFSRKAKMQSAEVEIHEILRQTVDLLRSSIEPSVAIDLDLSAGDPWTLGDPVQIQNVFLNLGLNARDAMPGGGRLRIATREVDFDEAHCRECPFPIEPGRFVEIEFVDQGTGMDPSILPHIFEPFFTTKDVGAGTGLGLSAAYGTVKDHAGTIEVSSEFGSGTTFRVCFPLHAPPATVEAQAAAEPARGQGTVLVIDDEDHVREMIADLLENLGYHVHGASDGVEGCAIYQRNDGIDLVILDMVMPRMSGQQTLARLREHDPDVRVILCSGYNRDFAIDRAMEDGVVDYLQKPFRMSRLGEVVGKELGGGRETED